MSFKVNFNIKDYDDVTPSKQEINEYTQKDFIINEDQYQKGNIDNCVWKKYKPTYPEMMSSSYQQQEIRRVKKGAWIAIKEDLIYLPPNYYYALQYGKTGGEDLQFRLKRLKHVYFKLRARNNPQCKGTFTAKNRQDGETTMAISDAFWETFDMEEGQIGIMSKTRNDALNPCWKTMQSLYMGMPRWMFEFFFGDCETNGKNIAETIKFLRFSDDAKGVSAKNILLTYYPSVYNAMDGKNNMKRAIADECLKWLECNFGDFFNNASKFIMPGFERRGLFDMFSSPPEKMSQSYKDGYELWLRSDASNLAEGQTTESRIHRYYSNPLDGIQGAYDKFGDADPERIYDWIIAERKRQPKDKLLEEVRGFPLNEQELWGSLEGGDFWDNGKGIEERKIYIIGRRFKDEISKEPTTVYGNLEWKDGIKDSEPVFRQSDKIEFDVGEARFSFSYMPQNREPLKRDSSGIVLPPNYVEDCLGIDSVDKRYPGKRASDVGMVNWKFRDVLETGIVKCPTFIYSNRPIPVEIAYEDAIKAAVFNRSMMQVESANLNIVNYGEDRGYIKWFLSKAGQPKNSLMKGDMPSGKSAFIDEIVGLINAVTNIPLTPEDVYHLLKWWHYELLDDVSKFNKKDTHANHLSMALGQAIIGSVKILFEKKREKSPVNNAVLSYLLG